MQTGHLSAVAVMVVVVVAGCGGSAIPGGSVSDAAVQHEAGAGAGDGGVDAGGVDAAREATTDALPPEADTGAPSADAGAPDGDSGAPASDASADSVTPTADAGASTSCDALVLWFVGCNQERRTECEREYSAVSSANRAKIDLAVTCLASLSPSKFPPSPTWPASAQACTAATATCPSCDNSYWLHGGCQTDTGDVAFSVSADPGFPACGGDGGQPACFFGLPNSGSTL